MSRRARNHSADNAELMQRPDVARVLSVHQSGDIPPEASSSTVPKLVRRIESEGLMGTAGPLVVALALGHAKDGRHMAVEVHLQGSKVVRGLVLAAHERQDVVVRAWEQCAWARLSEQREYNEFERTANERDSRGVRLEDFAHGSALAMPQQGRQYAVLAMDLEGGTATEPRVLLAKGDKLTAWGTLAAWAALNLLPRRKK